MTGVPEPYRATWPAVPASVPAARRSALSYLRAAETSDPPLSDVALVVSEAVTNCVHHAYRGGDAGEIRLAIRFSEDELVLTVEDDGGGMIPRPDTPGLGLGLPLIATVADRFDTQANPGRGTRISAWFRRDPGAATLPA